MARKLDLDYICYLENKWRNYYFSKNYDSSDPEKRMIWDSIVDTIDDMKNNYGVGIMLYDLFKEMETGSFRIYNRKPSKNKK